MPTGHPFADRGGVTVADLAKEPLLLAEEARAPEFNQFTVEMCRAVGFTPTVYRGTVESIRAAADLVAAGRCLYCVPSSCIAALPGTIWRPLTERPPTTRGRSCGARPTSQPTCRPSSAAPRRCPSGSAGWQEPTRQCTEYPHAGASFGCRLVFLANVISGPR